MCAALSNLGLPGDALLAAVRGPPRHSHALASRGGAAGAGHVQPRGRTRFANTWARQARSRRSRLARPGRSRRLDPRRGRRLPAWRIRRAIRCRPAPASASRRNSPQPAAPRSRWSAVPRRAASDACAALAREFGLLGSVGSDFHDPQLAWNPLGRLAKLPDGDRPGMARP